jgi:hypothetical protein
MVNYSVFEGENAMNIKEELAKEHYIDLKTGIEEEQRLGYFKRGIKNKKEETELLKEIIKIFAYHYFILYNGEAPKEKVWKNIVKNVKIDGIDFESIPDPNHNNYSGLLKVARTITNPPIYTLKTEFDYIKPTYRLAKAMGYITESSEDTYQLSIKNFPHISLIGLLSGENSYSVKQKLAEKAVERLKKYVTTSESKPKPSYVALAGGTTILRFVSSLTHSLSTDSEFMENVIKKISPITMVEIAKPDSLLALGLMENSRTTQLVFEDMGLSKKESYITYEQLVKKMNHKKEKFKLSAIYTGIGKNSEHIDGVNNKPLKEMLIKENLSHYLFEINGVPYFESKEDTKKSRMLLKSSHIIPLESIESEYKIVICGGEGKEEAVYNLIQYCVKNPDISIATHIIMEHKLFSKILILAQYSSR